MCLHLYTKYGAHATNNIWIALRWRKGASEGAIGMLAIIYDVLECRLIELEPIGRVACDFGRDLTILHAHQLLVDACCPRLVIWEQNDACLCAIVNARQCLHVVADVVGDAVGCTTPP